MAEKIKCDYCGDVDSHPGAYKEPVFSRKVESRTVTSQNVVCARENCRYRPVQIELSGIFVVDEEMISITPYQTLEELGLDFIDFQE